MMEQAYEIPEDTKDQYLTQYEQINHFFVSFNLFNAKPLPASAAKRYRGGSRLRIFVSTKL